MKVKKFSKYSKNNLYSKNPNSKEIRDSSSMSQNDK